MPNFLQNDYGVRESMADTTYPSSGSWNVGDFVLNSAPAIGQPAGWVCTTAGSPGTWSPVTLIQNVGNVATLTAAGNVAATANIVSVTGSGGFNATLALPSASNNGSTVSIVNATAGSVTAVAATGAAVVGLAVVSANTSGSFKSNSTNWYRI